MRAWPPRSWQEILREKTYSAPFELRRIELDFGAEFGAQSRTEGQTYRFVTLCG